MTRTFLTFLLCIFLAAPALAGPVEDSIVRQLRDQGFGQIEIERTFLGRVRIVARSEKLEREIVVDPRTGEILRDYWVEHGKNRPVVLFDPAGSDERGKTGDIGVNDDDGDDSGDDDDSDDDDSDDDDGDDDDGDDDDEGGDDEGGDDDDGDDD